MEISNLAKVLDICISIYPVSIPVAILLVVVAGCCLDWLRIFIVGYVDDFETPTEKKFWPFVGKLVSGKSRIKLLEQLPTIKGRGDEDITVEQSKTGRYVVVDGFWKWYVFETTEDANLVREILSKTGARTTERWLRGKEVDSPVLLLLQLFILFLILTAVWLLPPAVSVGTLLGYALLRIARKTVRLGKKFMAHTKDPDAHKSTEEQT